MDDAEVRQMLQRQTETRFCHEEEPLGRDLRRRIDTWNSECSSRGAFHSGTRIGKVLNMLVEHEAERTLRYVRVHLAICEEAGVAFDEDRADWLKARVASMVEHRGEGIRRQVRDDQLRAGADKDSRLQAYLEGEVDRGLGRARGDAFREVSIALGRSALAVHRAEGERLAESRENADPLTGFVTREALDLILPATLEQCRGPHRPVAVIMIDLDKFKEANDTHGHEQGDQILRETGELLRRIIGGRGTIGRYGGDEFEVILPNFTAEEARAVAERARLALATQEFTQVDRATPGLSLTMTLGVAAFPEHGQSAADLRRSADEALYRAKAAGRNCVVVADANEAPAPA